MYANLQQLVIRMSKLAIYVMIVCQTFSMAMATESTAQRKYLEEIEVKISEDSQSRSLLRLIQEIESVSNFKFAYSKSEMRNRTVDISGGSWNMRSLLKEVSTQGKLSIQRVNESIALVVAEQSEPLPSVVENVFEQQSVTGTITDDNGEALPGATIQEKGTTNGTITDVEGRFSLNVTSDATLTVSFVGYETQEIIVNNRTRIDIKLAVDSEQLEEVVVVGYGTQRKIDVNGSVSIVNAEDMASLPTSANFEQGLQGRVPGLQMTNTSAEPGGGNMVIIRGANSLAGGNEPLYVIDGIPMINNNTSRPGGWENQPPLNLLSSLNPKDIESVQVLKDASATAIYGSRGANGVILIQTKKGSRGKAVVELDYSHTFSKASQPFSLVNAYDYARLENEYLTNRGTPNLMRFTSAPNIWGLENVSPDEIRDQYGEGTNWFDEVLRTGSIDNYNVSISGGTEAVTYHISANYFDQEGVVIASEYKKGSIRGNMDIKVNEKLKLGFNMSVSQYDANRISQTGRVLGGGPDRLGTVLESFRASPLTKPNQGFEPNNLTQYLPGTGTADNFTYNPVKNVGEVDNSDQMNFFIGSVSLDYQIFDDLSITFRGGGNIQSQERINFIPKTTPTGIWNGGLGNHNWYDQKDYVFENFLTYNKKINKHNLNLVGGYSAQMIKTSTLGISGGNYNHDALRIYGWSTATILPPPSDDVSKRTLASYYGRLFYSFDDRYQLTFTGRVDGSSVFAANNKWAFFPSVGMGWVISNESFMEGTQSWLSNLKLRGSYGHVGNQAIGPYGSLSTVRSVNVILDGQLYNGMVPNTPANPDLTWETTKQVDIGADFGLLGDRVQVSLDYYKKNTVDLLQNKPVALVSGYGSFTTNFGEVSNTGFEISLGGFVVDRSSFRWNTNINWSFNRGKIEDLGTTDEGTIIETAGTPSNNLGYSSTRFVLGQPISTFWGYQVDGLLSQEDIDAGHPTLGGLDSPGDTKFVDLNNDGTINADDQGPIGNGQPDFLFGWNNTLTYKGFTLNAFLDGRIGSDVLNLTKVYTENGLMQDLGGRPSQAYADDYWTPENTDAKYPRPGGGYNSEVTGVPINSFIENGTFVRIKTISIGYDIPLNNIKNLSKANIYVMGTDLITFDDYSGFHPEVGSGGQLSYSQNVDLGNYPRPWNIVVGFKLGF